MALGISAVVNGLFSEGIKFLALDSFFNAAKSALAQKGAEKAAAGIMEHGAKWWGLDRSDDRLLAALYVRLHKYHEAEYEGLRQALDVLWQELLNIDNGRGKWAKRWRMTFVGIAMQEGAHLPEDEEHKPKLKCRTPVLNRKNGEPALGPDGEVLYDEEYFQHTGTPLELSKDDPRLRHLYLTAKMAREELDAPLQVVGNGRLPKTVNHLMVTYLQDDPFFKLMGKAWGTVITWLEGRDPLIHAQATAWLNGDERAAIAAIRLNEADKAELRSNMVAAKKEFFRDDLRKVKEEPFWRGLLRYWWLLALVVGALFLHLA